jgi:polygalacturonase
MNILGDIGGGRIGNLSKEQAVAWALKHDSRTNKIVKQNMKSVVERVMGMSGDTTTGGANTRYTFDGAPIYHESKGARLNEGATIFFVKRPGDVARIVATGYHTGAQTYALTWTHHDWSALRNVNQISLD